MIAKECPVCVHGGGGMERRVPMLVAPDIFDAADLFTAGLRRVVSAHCRYHDR
jgi:hypothetical protein